MIKLEIKEAHRPVSRISDTLLISGDGWSAPDDIERFNELLESYDIMAIGRSIELHNGHPVDHWANVDSDSSVHWARTLPLTARNGEQPIRHTLGPCKEFDVDWDIVGDIPWQIDEVMWHGSTAFFAVLAGLELGYKKLVLAGVPMDSKGHWYFDQKEYPGPPWTYQSYQAWFEFAETKEAKQVRSMSGYTKTLLGKPTRQWLSKA